MPKVLALAASMLAALFIVPGAFAQGFDFVAGGQSIKEVGA
jgi:hypothetical protein